MTHWTLQLNYKVLSGRATHGHERARMIAENPQHLCMFFVFDSHRTEATLIKSCFQEGNKMKQNELVIFETADNAIKLEVPVEGETVWLNRQQMADLYDTTKQNISSHIKNIFDEEELIENSTVKEFLTVQKEGNRNVERKVKYYNLDMIISLGYRIKSKVATNFRKWATEILKEYMIKDFTMDDERLKGQDGGNY